MAINFIENPEFDSIKTANVNGTLYFDGIDAAEKLGYSNPMQAISDNVDERDVFYHDVQTSSGKQQMIVINESGYYSLVLSCKTPKAKAFTDKVTTQILPAILTYGLYAKDDKLKDISELLKSFRAYKVDRDIKSN